jgi:hypothetical protein
MATLRGRAQRIQHVMGLGFELPLLQTPRLAVALLQAAKPVRENLVLVFLQDLGNDALVRQGGLPFRRFRSGATNTYGAFRANIGATHPPVRLSVSPS